MNKLLVSLLLTLGLTGLAHAAGDAAGQEEQAAQGEDIDQCQGEGATAQQPMADREHYVGCQIGPAGLTEQQAVDLSLIHI